MTNSPKDQLQLQLAQHVIHAGQRTLDVVGYGRGASKKATYMEMLAVRLAAQLQNNPAFPLRVVLDWPVIIEGARRSFEDPVIPLVITLPVRESVAVLVEDAALKQMPPQIEFDDLRQLTPPDIDLFPLLPVFGNVSTGKKPFPKDFLQNTSHLSDRIGAPFHCLVNFGKPHIRTFFPQTRKDKDVSGPTTSFIPISAAEELETGHGNPDQLLPTPEEPSDESASRIEILDIKLPSAPKTD